MSDFRAFLLNLFDSLEEEELAKLKFMCGDKILPGQRQKLKEGYQLWEKLENLDLLSEEKPDYLATKLANIGKKKLSDQLLEYGTGRLDRSHI